MAKILITYTSAIEFMEDQIKQEALSSSFKTTNGNNSNLSFNISQYLQGFLIQFEYFTFRFLVDSQ